MRQLKEVYLSIFVLFFRISRWKGRLKTGSASVLVSTVVGIFAFTIWIAMQTLADVYIPLNRWIIGGAFGAVFVANDYVLVTRSHGVAFEKQFRSSFSKRKQITLYFVAVSVVVAIGIALFFTVESYHQTFNLPRK